MMFSSRTDFDLRPNPLADQRARMHTSGEAILDITESNPTRCGFEYPKEAILDELSCTDRFALCG